MSYKKWIIVAISLFVVGFVSGLNTPASMVNLLSKELAALDELAGLLAPLPKFIVFVIIFLKNTSTLLLSFILSPILCLLPILVLTLNSWLLASVSVIIAQEKSVWFVLAGLLPHGVFELPALILGEAAALSFGAIAVILVLRKESRTVLVSTARKDVRHVLLSLALVFIVGTFHAIIVVGLLGKETRELLMANLRQNLRYLLVALALLLPAAIIETFVTPLLLT